MTRISIYTQNCNHKHCHDIKPINHFLEQVRLAAHIASGNSADLLILPLHSLGFRSEYHREYDGEPNPKFSQKAVNEGLKILQSVSDAFNITLLGEIDNVYWFQPHQPLRESMNQCFAFGNDSLQRKSDFLKAFQSPNRLFAINDIKIRTMICGENNILRVPQKSGELIMPENLIWDWDYDVLINPTHDSTRRWRELLKRYPYWSQGNRTVIYVTNNTRKSSWTTAVRVFRDGKMFLGGDFEQRDDLQKHIEERWRMVTIEV